MKKYTLVLLALLPIGLLAYSYSLFSFLLIAFIALSLVVLLVAGAVKACRGSMSRRWLQVPLLVVAVSAAGIVIGLLRPLEPAILRTGDVSQTLAYAYKTDQQDRMTLRFYLGRFRKQVRARDRARLEQVKKLYESRPITKPLDQFHAAFVFHHGHKSKLYEIAHQLASQAASANKLKDTYQVQWLAKATYDRWMLSIGKQQKYGTQGTFSLHVE